MYSDESKPSALATQLSVYDYVVVDTCSLMEDSFPNFADVLTASKEYWKEGLEILVPSECLKELKKHSRDRRRESIARRIAAKRARKILKHAKWHKVITILKSKEETFADNQIYNFVNTHRLNSKVAVITQDKFLASDLRKQNNLNSQHGIRIDVLKLAPNGALIPNKGDPNGNRPNPKFDKPYNPKFPNNKRENEPAKDPILINDERLSSNLTNPNYSAKRKENDIRHQLGLLKGVSEEKLKEYRLRCPIPELESKLKELEALDKVEAKAEVKVDLLPRPKEKKILRESEPKAPSEKPLASGRNCYEALNDYCLRKGIIVRDASINYFAPVHGPLDITIDDLNAIVSKLPRIESERYPLDFKGTKLELIFADRKIQVYAAREEAKEEAKKAEPKPRPQMLVKAKVPETVQNQGQIDENDPSRPLGKSNRKTVQATSRSVVPHGATLIVGVPDNENQAKRIERKVTRDGEKAQAEEPKQEKKTQPKKAETKKAETKKAPATKVPKKPAKAKEEKPVNENVETALKADKRLQANLSNPNYAPANKLKDVSAQIELLHKLTPKERTGLKFGLRELNAKAKELKKETGDSL